MNMTILHSIVSKKHVMSTITQQKCALSAADDKRYILPNKIDTLPWGHKNIPQEDDLVFKYCENTLQRYQLPPPIPIIDLCDTDDEDYVNNDNDIKCEEIIVSGDIDVENTVDDDNINYEDNIRNLENLYEFSERYFNN